MNQQVPLLICWLTFHHTSWTCNSVGQGKIVQKSICLFLSLLPLVSMMHLRLRWSPGGTAGCLFFPALLGILPALNSDISIYMQDLLSQRMIFLNSMLMISMQFNNHFEKFNIGIWYYLPQNIMVITNMWENQAKWVWTRAHHIFSFLLYVIFHSKGYVLQKTPLKFDMSFQSYDILKGYQNNRKQKNLFPLFGSFSKSIFANSDSFCLIIPNNYNVNHYVYELHLCGCQSDLWVA